MPQRAAEQMEEMDKLLTLLAHDLKHPAGAIEVERELSGAVGPAQQISRLLAQRLGDTAVEPTALWRKEFAVDHLPDERVAEQAGKRPSSSRAQQSSYCIFQREIRCSA